MKYKMGFAFICMVICLFAIAGVCASDANETSSAVGDSIGNDETIGIGNVTDGDFTELTKYIENASEDSVLFLYKDYKYYSGHAEGISLNKSLTIDGGGHVFDGANQSRILLISHANVTLKNLMFTNGFADDCGGAIHLENATLDIQLYIHP